MLENITLTFLQFIAIYICVLWVASSLTTITLPSEVITEMVSVGANRMIVGNLCNHSLTVHKWLKSAHSHGTVQCTPHANVAC